MHKHTIDKYFISVQGEGSHVGLPSIFLRFSECNLKCSFCDTNDREYNEVLEEELVSKIHKISDETGIVILTITGGEPSLYDINRLIRKLKVVDGELKMFIITETNGFRFENIRESDYIVYSPKQKPIDLFTLSNGRKSYDEMKILLTDDIKDFEDVKNKYPMVLSPDIVPYLQPINYIDKINIENVKKAYNIVMNSDNYLKLSVQLHKIIGVE